MIYNNAAASLTVLAASLSMVIGLEYHSYSQTPIASHRPLPELVRRQSILPAVHNVEADTTIILARPLFQFSRRPMDTSKPDPEAGRLTGILVSGTEKLLTFAQSSGDKSIVVSEGDRISSDIVESITSEYAVLLRSNGSRTTIYPMFEKPKPTTSQAIPAKTLPPPINTESRISKYQH